ncbi:hypothetical protein [Spiroplasma endosymbiont of Seladonia tumulorum]|uniref:hypothetical protein n=1 Tax=Spiroplasma endosymbiont of Seladonia tumulorum TaxID=3066321 RepID=UPI0030CAF4F5
MANLRLELGNYTVKMYYRSKCLFNNPNLIVYDLDTLYYLWMGNFAQEQMEGNLNIVKTRLIEHNKLICLKSLLIYLNNLELDFSTNQISLVQNFVCSVSERIAIMTNFPKLKWITIKQHYGLLVQRNDFYVDVKSKTTIIYQRSTKDLFKLNYGWINCQNIFQQYLNHNFNVMLSVSDLITLIPNLCQRIWTSYKIKALCLEKGLFSEVVITDYEKAMAGFLFFIAKN